MAKRPPFVPVGKGGRLLVPNNNPDKVDKIMDWQFQSKEGFGEPRKPGDTIHQHEDTDVEGYAKGGMIKGVPHHHNKGHKRLA